MLRNIAEGKVGGRIAGSSVPHYYEAMGRGADYLLRCKDCRKLLTQATIGKLGSCPCGNRKVVQVQTLSLWETIRIRLGLLRFPYRREFMREFGFKW